jgi:hypothetical protein
MQIAVFDLKTVVLVVETVSRYKTQFGRVEFLPSDPFGLDDFKSFFGDKFFILQI